MSLYLEQDEVLRRFVIRLQGVLGLNDKTCFIADDPYRVDLGSAPDRGFIVSYNGGSFYQGEQYSTRLVEAIAVSVTAFNRLHALDEGGRTKSIVAENQDNLFKMKKRVLSALVCWDLSLPTDSERPQLSSLLRFVQSDKVYILRNDNGANAGFLTVQCVVDVPLNLCV